MSNSDERREVARMMRDPFDVYRCYGGVAFDGTIYGMTVRADYEGALRDGMRRLADLIDPTCSMEYGGHVPDSVKDALGVYFCSECGSPIYNDMEPEYCPYCGARVTGGGEG